MNALSAAAELRPLVVDLGDGHFAWIESNRGHVLNTTAGGTWLPFGGVVHGIGGIVLRDAEVAELVKQHGRPTR